jgi:hypothetical protein
MLPLSRIGAVRVVVYVLGQKEGYSLFDFGIGKPFGNILGVSMQGEKMVNCRRVHTRDFPTWTERLLNSAVNAAMLDDGEAHFVDVKKLARNVTNHQLELIGNRLRVLVENSYIQLAMINCMSAFRSERHSFRTPTALIRFSKEPILFFMKVKGLEGTV